MLAESRLTRNNKWYCYKWLRRKSNGRTQMQADVKRVGLHNKRPRMFASGPAPPHAAGAPSRATLARP